MGSCVVDILFDEFFIVKVSGSDRCLRLQLDTVVGVLNFN